MSNSKKFKMTVSLIAVITLLGVLAYFTWRSSPVTETKQSYIHDYIEEDVVSLVEQSKLYLDKRKLIDSLSSGKRGLSMIVTLNDTAKNIYLVKVSENNKDSLVTCFNFLVDANKMVILNPTGKLKAQ